MAPFHPGFKAADPPTRGPGDRDIPIVKGGRAKVRRIQVRLHRRFPARRALVNEASKPIAYFDSTFEEALVLTREARDYIADQKPAEMAKLAPITRLAASCESMRMTARITQVVAWLLVQRAVHAGEISRADARKPRYRLGGQKVCRASGPRVEESLPDHLLWLLERSDHLYQRVARLDAMLDRTDTDRSIRI